MDSENGKQAIEQTKVRMTPDRRLDSDNAARYLGKSTKTLAQLRMQGKGPCWVKVGGRVFYFLEALDRYIRGEAA